LFGGALYLILFIVSKYLCARFGGLSGDLYGAINEFATLAVLFLFSVAGKVGCAGWMGVML